MKGIHRWPVDSPHKGPITRKMFPFDDVIMVYLQIVEQFSNLWLIYAQLPMLIYSLQILCLYPSQALPLCNAPDMYGQGLSHWRKALPATPNLLHKLFLLLIMHIHTEPMFVLYACIGHYFCFYKNYITFGSLKNEKYVSNVYIEIISVHQRNLG